MMMLNKRTQIVKVKFVEFRTFALSKHLIDRRGAVQKKRKMDERREESDLSKRRRSTAADDGSMEELDETAAESERAVTYSFM